MARTPVYSGKVRDIYAVDDDKYLFVASNRLSVFDVVLNETVPDKGAVLTGMTHDWLGQLADLAPSHESTVTQSVPHASAAHADSYPSCSASRARSISSCGFVPGCAYPM